MKVSVFNQFSSNHSAGFQILGEFQTEAEAKAVASELKQLDADIISWRRKKMIEEDDRLRREGKDVKRGDLWAAANDVVSQPEMDFAKRHGLEPFTLDFVGPSSIDSEGRYDGHLEVSHAGRFVCTADSMWDTWVTEVPALEQYLRSQGARIITGSVTEENYEKLIQVTIKAVSDEDLLNFEIALEREAMLFLEVETAQATDDRSQLRFQGSLDSVFVAISLLCELGYEIQGVAELEPIPNE